MGSSIGIRAARPIQKIRTIHAVGRHAVDRYLILGIPTKLENNNRDRIGHVAPKAANADCRGDRGERVVVFDPVFERLQLPIPKVDGSASCGAIVDSASAVHRDAAEIAHRLPCSRE